ncbi:17840_t:CDS:1, partial [Entrophospora sp. SA101]
NRKWLILVTNIKRQDRVVDGAIGYKYNNWDPIEPQFTIHKD